MERFDKELPNLENFSAYKEKVLKFLREKGKNAREALLELAEVCEVLLLGEEHYSHFDQFYSELLGGLAKELQERSFNIIALERPSSEQVLIDEYFKTGEEKPYISEVVKMARQKDFKVYCVDYLPPQVKELDFELLEDESSHYFRYFSQKRDKEMARNILELIDQGKVIFIVGNGHLQEYLRLTPDFFYPTVHSLLKNEGLKVAAIRGIDHDLSLDGSPFSNFPSLRRLGITLEEAIVLPVEEGSITQQAQDFEGPTHLLILPANYRRRF